MNPDKCFQQNDYGSDDIEFTIFATAYARTCIAKSQVKFN